MVGLNNSLGGFYSKSIQMANAVVFVDAFYASTSGTISVGCDGSLLSSTNKFDKAALSGVLTCHVVAGKVMVADVVKMDSAKTVQEQSVAIKEALIKSYFSF